MLKLAGASTSQIFTIPPADWTAINKRVGCVLAAQQIQTIVTESLPGYPALLASSRIWTGVTFAGLIAQAKALAEYAASAITSFSGLNQSIQQVPDGIVPDTLKQLTTDTLRKLAVATSPLAEAFNTLGRQVMDFLDANRIVDAQLTSKEAEKLGGFWTPVGNNIARLENANGHVMGDWRAITADLAATLASPIEVTSTFIESLEIDAAIACWRNVRDEAAHFSIVVTGQQQYWSNPFYDSQH